LKKEKQKKEVKQNEKKEKTGEKKLLNQEKKVDAPITLKNE